MLYFSTPSSPDIRRAMSAGRFGCMTTPKQGNEVPPGAVYAADNGKFGAGWPGEVAWFEWLTLKIKTHGADLCAFATAPDVVGDAIGTLIEASPWLPKIRALGVPAAFVAQDGCDIDDLIPWGEFDVLFLGGTDDFKLGEAAVWVTAVARSLGVPVHMGRVNSRKRLVKAIEMGCATSDGTFFAFGPDINLKRMTRYLTELGEL